MNFDEVHRKAYNLDEYDWKTLVIKLFLLTLVELVLSFKIKQFYYHNLVKKNTS